MTGTAKADTAGQRRAVFAVDEDAALAALEEAWAEGGYHAFSADSGIWSAIGSAGEVLTGAKPMNRTRRSGRTGRRCSDKGRPVNQAYGRRSLGPPPRGAFQDCVERRRRFEAEQTGVTIVTPARPDDRWRAILPLGVLPDDGTTIGAWSLCDLMNKLDALYPHGEQG